VGIEEQQQQQQQQEKEEEEEDQHNRICRTQREKTVVLLPTFNTFVLFLFSFKNEKCLK